MAHVGSFDEIAADARRRSAVRSPDDPATATAPTGENQEGESPSKEGTKKLVKKLRKVQPRLDDDRCGCVHGCGCFCSLRTSEAFPLISRQTCSYMFCRFLNHTDGIKSVIRMGSALKFSTEKGSEVSLSFLRLRLCRSLQRPSSRGFRSKISRF